MTTGAEIRGQFNLHYDNILSGASPGLNDYEISLLLTQAHREIIFNYYNGNTKGDSYDSSEKIKQALASYTRRDSITWNSNTTYIWDAAKTQVISSGTTSGFAGIPNMKAATIALGENVWTILSEALEVYSDTGLAVDILIKPIVHDEFYVLVDNPFKFPDKYGFRAWRMDQIESNWQEAPDDTKVLGRRLIVIYYNSRFGLIEGQSESNLTYKFSYLIKPEPLIIWDPDFEELDGLLDQNLTIEGIALNSSFTGNIPSQLLNNSWLLEMVINRAVELATRDYKQNQLDTQISLNQRAE